MVIMRAMKKADAIKAAGGVRALAQLLGLSHQAVSKWGADVPPLRAYEIRFKLPALYRRMRRAEGA